MGNLTIQGLSHLGKKSHDISRKLFLNLVAIISPDDENSYQRDYSPLLTFQRTWQFFQLISVEQPTSKTSGGPNNGPSQIKISDDRGQCHFRLLHE
jgi:hypothetical protein